MLNSVKHPTLGKFPRRPPRQLIDLNGNERQAKMNFGHWCSGFGGIRWVDSCLNFAHKSQPSVKAWCLLSSERTLGEVHKRAMERCAAGILHTTCVQLGQ